MVRFDDGSVPRPLHVIAAWSWRLLIILAALWLLVTVLVRLQLVTLSVFIALTLSTLAVPPARALESRGFPRGLAAATVIGGALAALVGLGVLLAPAFAAQIGALRPTIGQGVDRALQALEASPLQLSQGDLDDLISQAQEQLSGSGSQIVSGIASGFAIAASTLAGLVLIFVLLFFFVKDGRQLADWVVDRTPSRGRDLVVATGVRAWQALGGYVRGTATVALIDAVGIGLGLLVIGVPLVLPLAILVFLGAFLPVIGAFIAGLIAVLVALADGGVVDAALTLLVVLAVQQLEGNVLQPVVMRRAVALHPVVVLVALTAGASLAGIIGAFLSLPIMAVLAAVGNEIRLRAEAGGPDEMSPVSGVRGPEPLGPEPHHAEAGADTGAS